MEPCDPPVSRTSTKSPHVASCFLPLRVQTTCRRSASSIRNSRPKSATTRPSTTTCCSRSRRVVTRTGARSRRYTQINADGFSSPGSSACICAYPRTISCSNCAERIELRGADEVVLREAADRVGHVRDAALVVAHQHVGVVVLAMGDPRRGVHERHGLEVVPELVRLRDRAVGERPALEALQQGPDLLRREGSDAALAGLALLARELVHGAFV